MLNNESNFPQCSGPSLSPGEPQGAGQGHAFFLDIQRTRGPWLPGRACAHLSRAGLSRWEGCYLGRGAWQTKLVHVAGTCGSGGGAEDGFPRGGGGEKVPRASAECLSRCRLNQGGWGGRSHLPALLAEGPVSKVSQGHLAWTSGQPCPCPRVLPAHGHVLGGTHVAGLTGWVRNVFINAVFRAHSCLV